MSHKQASIYEDVYESENLNNDISCVYIRPRGEAERSSAPLHITHEPTSGRQVSVPIDKMWICTCVQIVCTVCHSGIKFMRAMRRAQTEKLVEVECEKGGNRGEEKGVVPELPAGSQCPELARRVDTEPVPDLKPPF